MTARRVLLWRHGRSAWNVEHRCQGPAEASLDEVGRVQSTTAAGLLAASSPVAMVSSVLRRAVHTAKPLTGLGLPVAPVERVPADVEALDAGPAGAPAR